MAKAMPRSGSVVWDERRNTSRVFPVPPDALPNALRLLAALRHSDPALVAWIEDGHPNLTDAEHVQRFGAPYRSHRAKRAVP